MVVHTLKFRGTDGHFVWSYVRTAGTVWQNPSVLWSSDEAGKDFTFILDSQPTI